MAKQEHLDILKQGVDVWNRWRWKDNNPQPMLDLSKVDLSGADLSKAHLMEADLRLANLSEANLSKAYLGGANLSGATNLSGANLSGAHLIEADLNFADLSGADLRGANLRGANLSRANLIGANLSKAYLGGANLGGADLRWADLGEANLCWAILIDTGLRWADLRWAYLGGANLIRADLTGADVSNANLENATLVHTELQEANLTNCRIYGISAWNLNLKGTKQTDLIITQLGEPIITVDNIEIAQFIYLILNNEKIRGVIDTITSKVVLILGRFTDKQKPVLDALRDALRRSNYCPVLFDFERPLTRNFIETVSTLAHMARFVIADVTDPKIVLQEIPHIVTNIAVPLIPLLLEGSGPEPITLVDLRQNHKSLLGTYYYKDSKQLLKSLKKKVIGPAEAKARELLKEQAAKIV